MATVTVTFNIDSNDIPDITAAYGALLGLPGPANAQQIKDYLAQSIAQQTQLYRRDVAMAAMQIAPAPVIT
jgi:hypothetical protein